MVVYLTPSVTREACVSSLLVCLRTSPPKYFCCGVDCFSPAESPPNNSLAYRTSSSWLTSKREI